MLLPPSVPKPLAVGLILLAAALMSPRSAHAIIGGSPADPGLAQSLVMVLAEGGVACSGVVLAPRIVMTAGHCLPKGKAIRVYAPLPDAPSAAPQLIPISASSIHPGFAANVRGTRRRSIDLALLLLSEILPSHFASATLAASPAPSAGAQVIVAGDGLTDEARPNSSGRPRSATLNVVEPYGRGAILLWASPASGAAGACVGDSGGAMLAETGRLLAIIAFAEGQGQARCGKLTQGVLVAPQRSFIDTTLTKWGEAARWADR